MMGKPISQVSNDKTLGRATDALFKVFAKYPKPPVEACIDTCGGPIPVSARGQWGKSLRAYTRDEVDDFARHSLCLLVGCGDWRETYQSYFKYWLPRFLPGLVESNFGIVFDDEFVLEGCSRSAWPNWPDTEIRAVRHWLFGWLSACLTCHPVDSPSASSSADQNCSRQTRFQYCEGPIDFAIGLGIDPTPQLYTATAELNVVTAEKFISIVKTYVPKFIARQKLEDKEAPGVLLKRELLRWLLHPSTAERLAGAYDALFKQDAGTSAEISEALDWISNLRTAYEKSPQGWPVWLA